MEKAIVDGAADPSRALASRFFFAFLLTILLVTCGEVLSQQQLAARSEDAGLINRAGRQRMLSQRLVRTMLWADLATKGPARDEATAEVESLRREWIAAQAELRRGAREPVLLTRFLLVAPDMDALDRIAKQSYADDGLLSPKDQAMAVAASDRYLNGMELVVGRYTEIADGKLAVSRWLTLGIYFATALVLLGQVIFIYRPSIQEITEAFRRDRELLDKARAGQRSRELFIANISHEVRTPLNGILGLTRLALDDAKDPLVRERLSLSLQSGESLLGILNDVIEYAREDGAELGMRPEPTDVRGLTEEVLALARPMAAPGVTLVAEADSDFPSKLLVDPGRLRQILGNLVSNAVKFTDEGSVAVELEYWNDELGVTVRDTGPGIEPELKDRLFEAFVAGDESARRRHGGAGLGLSIVKRIVDRMAGTIALQSELGEGTIVRVRIPASIVTTPGNRPSDPAAGSSSLRVLVVEDDEINRRVVGAFLFRLGHAPELAPDAFEGLRLFAESEFDVVLMDWHLPDLDGIEATQRLRELPRGRRTPVIAFTASALPQDRARLEAAGMDGFLAKPVRPEDLAREIARVRATIGE